MKPSENEIAYSMKHQILKYRINNGGCWIHKNKCNRDGYVRLRSAEYKANYMAHRLSYVLFKGSIPDNLFVCHTCDMPPCINPDHLFLGTRTDNQIDKYKKERGFPGGRRQLIQEDLDFIFTCLSDGYTQEEIALMLGITQGAVSYHKKKGR